MSDIIDTVDTSVVIKKKAGIPSLGSISVI